MPLHPSAQNFLDQRASAGAKPYNELTIEQAREQAVRLSALLGAGEAVALVQDRAIPGPRGEIPIRIYTPAGNAPMPLYVYFHGGGWVVGNLETTDFACRAICNAARCIVVNVNYRHAPEHKFPAAVDDAYAATQWVAQNAASFGGDAARVAVGGASAGGNLAAVVALMAREKKSPRIIFQVLTVPVTGYSFDTKSYQENADGYGLTRDVMRWFWQHYLPREADGAHPHASPLRASDLRGLPPAFVMTAEFDPLRDEGEAYAARLRAAGVQVSHQRYEGMVHAFLGAESTQDIARHLRVAFA